MKRILSFLICIILLLLLTSCTQTSQAGNELIDPVKFYYPRTEVIYGRPDGVIHYELREGQGHEYALTHFLEVYLEGPQDPQLYSPFPAGTSLTKLELKDGTAYLSFSEELASLTGIDLTVACTVITMTCLEHADVDRVQISAGKAMLDGSRSIVMNEDTAILTDGTVPTTAAAE